MTRVILNDDQARAVRGASDTVALLDQSGVLIGYVAAQTHFSPEEIEEAQRRANSDGPWLTTAEVLSRLSALEQG